MANASSAVEHLDSDMAFLGTGVSNNTLEDTKSIQIPNTELQTANNFFNQSRNVERTKKYICAILNCNGEFCSDQNLQNHNVLFRHSPCNPCLLILNLRTPLEPQCYMCPDCDQEFWDQTECQEHMLERLHLPFYPPLVITAYMCAQCLYLFENLESCWRHIEQMSHDGFYYPFADEASTSNCLSGPIPIAKELVNDLVKRCNQVAYSVQCLECSLVIESRHQLLQHVQETQNQHIIASMTETSLVDIFTSYITDFSCDVCHRLFIGNQLEKTKHQCAQSLSGNIIQNDIHSFLEFMKRCALTLVSSIDPSDEASLNNTAASVVVTQRHMESFIKQLATKKYGLVNETVNNPASRVGQNSNSVLTSVPGTSIKLYNSFAPVFQDVIVVSDNDVSDSEDYVIDLTDVSLVNDTVTSFGDTVSSAGGTVNSMGGTVSSAGGTVNSVGGTVSSVGSTVVSEGNTVTSVGCTVISVGGTFLQEIDQEKTATDVLLSSGTLHPSEKVNKRSNNPNALPEKLRQQREQKKLSLICEKTLTSDNKETTREQVASSVPREEHLDRDIDQEHSTEDLFLDDITDKNQITLKPGNAFRSIFNILTSSEIQGRNKAVVPTDVKSGMGLSTTGNVDMSGGEGMSTSGNVEDNTAKMLLEGVNENDVIVKAFETCTKTDSLKDKPHVQVSVTDNLKGVPEMHREVQEMQMECDYSLPLESCKRLASLHVRAKMNSLITGKIKRRRKRHFKKKLIKLCIPEMMKTAEMGKNTLAKSCSGTAVDYKCVEVTNENKFTTPYSNPSVSSVNCRILSDSKKNSLSVINSSEEAASGSEKAKIRCSLCAEGLIHTTQCTTTLLPTPTQSISALFPKTTQSSNSLLSTTTRNSTALLPTPTQYNTALLSMTTQNSTALLPTIRKSHTALLSTQSQSHMDLLPTKSQSHTTLLPTQSQSHTTLLPTQSQSHATLLPTQSQSHITLLPTQSQSHTTSLSTQSQSHTSLLLTQSQSQITLLPTQSQSHTTFRPTLSQSYTTLLLTSTPTVPVVNKPQLQVPQFFLQSSNWNNSSATEMGLQNRAATFPPQRGAAVTLSDSFQNPKPSSGVDWNSNKLKSLTNQLWSQQFKYFNKAGSIWNKKFGIGNFSNQSVASKWSNQSANINHSNQTRIGYQSNLTSSSFWSNQSGTSQQSNQSSPTVGSNGTSINYNSNQSGDLRGSRYNFGSNTSNNNCVQFGLNQPRTADQSSTESYLTSTEHLQTMKNIVFLDLDNWCSFFQKLPRCLPDKTFVWGFYGGKNSWFPPRRSYVFHRMSSLGLFYLNEQCGKSKDAADFAIVLTVGTMNERLPTEVSFTILSGDKGFHEVERQMRKSKRRVMVIDPHNAATISSDMIYALVTSVTET